MRRGAVSPIAQRARGGGRPPSPAPRAGRAGHLAVLPAVGGAAAVKAVATVLPLLAIGVWPRTANGGPRRLARALTWIEAAILTGYGLVLTASGLLVQAGVIEAVAHADRLALKWP